jgi:uncharacterized protein YcfJ
MSTSFSMGALIGAGVLAGAGAVAGYSGLLSPSGAEVLSAKPLMKTVKTPRQECHDEEVTRTKPVKDENRLIGTGLGAVVGGLLGNQVGGGSGKTLATVAGAAAGGYAGNRIQDKVQKGNTYTTSEQRCETVYDSHEEPNGYEVVYELKGKKHTVRMDHDPGRRLPLKDGHVVTSAES